MPDISLSEDFIKRLKVKVYLKEPDARLYLCGEPKQHNQDGSSYFVIPAHQRQYIKDIMPHYIVGEEYLEEKKSIKSLLNTKYALNPRQIQALHYLLAQGEGSYVNPSSYEALSGISRPTAIADLKAIEKMNLVSSKKVGKYVRYYGTPLLQKAVIRKDT